jgi:porphobilinogen synthase
VRSFILFPHVPPSLRSNWGEEAYNPDGLVPRAVRLIKETVPAQDTVVITDIALDPYSSEVSPILRLLIKI